MPPSVDFISCTLPDDATIPADNPLRLCGGLKGGFSVAAIHNQQFNASDYPGTFLQRAVASKRIWLDRLCGLEPTPRNIGLGVNGQPGYCNMQAPTLLPGLVDFVHALATAMGKGRFLAGYFGSFSDGADPELLRETAYWLRSAGFTHVGGDASAELPAGHSQWQFADEVVGAGMSYIAEPMARLRRDTLHGIGHSRCAVYNPATQGDPSLMGPGDRGGRCYATIQLGAAVTAGERASIAQNAASLGWVPVVDTAGMTAIQRAPLGLPYPIAGSPV